MKFSSHMTHQIEILGTIFFALAVLHTFSVKKFLDWSQDFPKESAASAILHFLGEIEVVFGLWAGIFYFVFGSFTSFREVVAYQENLQFAEPLFVFCILVVAASRPVLNLARDTIQFVSEILSKATGISRLNTDLFVILTFGPLSGSFITEPAAMTVTALLLLKMMDRPTNWFAHFLIGLLFVNVSIGGALTPYAAPPILMVAGTWNWDFNFVFSQFGWKSLLAVTSNTLIFLFLGQKYLKNVLVPLPREASAIPWPVTFVHYAFL
ncbi:MAG: putative Na+/H+ antiporter, partial [Bdellovibrio sp.]